MKILALETATEACSIALQVGDEVIVDHRIAPRQHTELLLPMIKELLSKASLQAQDLDGIAFGRGPGAFTGVRIACGIAQGLALGAGVPLLSVSTLQTLAQGAYRQHGAEKIITAIDARMNEVYYAAFEITEKRLAQALIFERVCAPENIESPESNGSWCGVGTGFASYAQALNCELGQYLTKVIDDALPNAIDILPMARDLLAQGKVTALEDAVPVYLRDNIAKKSTKRVF
ncbi:tRNA (adenosine(37)-N6)-threonylcarbamoyltransferase complex dimerization subunit type 1 TsaB [Piscirickettsia litoralis]|uniref:tRNA threonylcarbamoyladenosine biosynthesis protein TsaB n=1 Tax=Piscirickettsia litoralis TaxID=1891921 RepID=A0ABX3A1F1_9GAMM|nr:tRNA (adenosine(37)-N6)-threonylcarbamoyltransferase complex dimerization subunit type 1 TsaB [Piscirickettsia litoralis]ODN42315.1 tRNA (adenosine(37)-N6)-threonylcarbamoyltransferase complex dimerization subunit type 1 TsaB [Piscirickettsia litoralis]